MSKVVAFMSVTLDGVMQAPGRPDEDERGGFRHGGWAAPYMDPVLAQKAAEGSATNRGLLLGRRTYEDFFGFWPHQTDNPFTDVLNNMQKYVASTTLKEPLPWANSTLLSGDAVDAVATLREESGGDLVILGSGVLTRSLMKRALVDEYVLLIHPLVLGTGQRLFHRSPKTAVRLVETTTSSTGVVVATYRPATGADQREAPTSG